MTEKQSSEIEKEWNDFFNDSHINNYDRNRAFVWWNQKLSTLETKVREEEREKVLELLDEMSKHDWGDLTNYESHEVGVPRGYKRAIAELRTKLNQLKET